MKKRQLVSLFLFVVLGLAVFIGCEDVAQVQTPINFAQLRVANFNSTCLDSIPTTYDVYIYPVGQPAELAIVRGGLGYGEVSPWVDNLATNRDAGLAYKVQVRAAGDVENKNLIDAEITLKAGDRQTLWIFKQMNEGSLDYKFISDNPTVSIEQTKAYFRFINTEEGTGDLSIRVSDAQGNMLGGSAASYKNVTPYEGFTSTTIDTSITFFVVDNTGNIRGSLAGFPLEGGTYKTITWGGVCPGHYAPQEDPNAVKTDSLRVRILNDAGDGADLTKVVPQTLRYFFVNALLPPINDSIANLVKYGRLGIVINNDNQYNFAPMEPYSVGPPPVRTTADGIFEVIPTTTLLTDAISVKGYVYNETAPNVRGAQLFSYLAGPRSDIKSDMLVAFVLSDSVRKPNAPANQAIDSAKSQYVFPIPDQPKAEEAILVIANMMANATKTPATNKGEFWVNDVPVEKPGGANWTARVGAETVTIQGDIEVTVKARINASDADTYTRTFRVEKGGIYFVVLVGRRLSPKPIDQPRFMVIRTNPIYR